MNIDLLHMVLLVLHSFSDSKSHLDIHKSKVSMLSPNSMGVQHPARYPVFYTMHCLALGSLRKLYQT